MTPDADPERHLFTGWLLGPKRFIAVVIAFCLILGAKTWWEFAENLAQAQCQGLPDFGCWANAWAKAVVAGLVTASFCLLSLWFISYFTREVWQMIAELFKESRFQRGLQRGFAQGHGQGRQEGLEQGRREGIQQVAAQQKAWEGWNSRREQADAEGREFTEPPPTLKTNRNGQ